ncbi:hypothetical protein LDK18_00070 [Fusobacterium nucleatum subsp. nucleatum ATCC 23726]|uniref:ParB/Sulfiredoxin domain-containing protein n=1 Tax=Fusobacterium nucleatum subsp. nucleatum (strain ATCC 23726 / VPI 4351) TaxID=525283 RepID=D5RF06_FUSN2|nr:hypothetical protein [Fusobacterium nucleatum]AVQ22740.1 hypothetical protein C4N14_03405 [Fusobacterium nucleatum subsp. nucleatum ATCC 23726]EFG94625.1 hypothetical protein HMPREF0397_1791 [Fusobacterium nucleatum subsp. nucleatum ATCC 23726]ERT43808.1 hypothetical protein HMPREF1539_00457 [Fusobacterium nucleatum CTI-2]
MNLLENGLLEKFIFKTENKKRLVIGNIPKDYPIYKIRLDKLFYNDQNDRISTWISEYKMKNNIDKIDYSDKESYNKIIHEFITNSNYDAMKRTQQNIEAIGQIEAGVVLADGRIIDGNRRFTCLRNIQEKNQKEQYFEAVILDYSIEHNEKQIKMLELVLQHGVDEKVGYSPIERLVGIYHDIVETKLLTIAEYAKSVNDTGKNIEIEVEKAKLLAEFLEFINAKKQFYLARHLELADPLKELYVMLKKINDEETQDDLKNAVFSQFICKPAGDLTRYIRKIKDIASNPKHLKDYLDEQSPVVEKVCDKLEGFEQLTNKEIGELGEDKGIKEEFSRITEKYVSRVAGDITRNAPLKSMEKACYALDEIDLKILHKLKDEQIKDLKEKITELENITQKIKEEISGL